VKIGWQKRKKEERKGRAQIMSCTRQFRENFAFIQVQQISHRWHERAQKIFSALCTFRRFRFFNMAEATGTYVTLYQRNSPSVESEDEPFKNSEEEYKLCIPDSTDSEDEYLKDSEKEYKLCIPDSIDSEDEYLKDSEEEYKLCIPDSTESEDGSFKDSEEEYKLCIPDSTESEDEPFKDSEEEPVMHS
jgi:hypothetical protein